VVSDPGTHEVHDLGEINLVAGGGQAGILPGQRVPVEVVATAAIPAYELAGATVGAALKERSKLLVAGKHTAVLVEDPWDQRALQDRVGEVQLE
jgi:hypothetical protein